jgi:hypothetical protein
MFFSIVVTSNGPILQPKRSHSVAMINAAGKGNASG